ncbi:hypothetical protein [Paenibacillus foliorum]|nr:hypothetical protein [Paenibacillus foliorum]
MYNGDSGEAAAMSSVGFERNREFRYFIYGLRFKALAEVGVPLFGRM